MKAVLNNINIFGGDGDSNDIGIVALPEVGFDAGVSHGCVVGCLTSFTLFDLMLHNTVKLVSHSYKSQLIHSLFHTTRALLLSHLQD